jgi:type I restriction enzyme S subunit
VGEWVDTTLGEVLTLQRGFDLPETEREPGEHPVIASTGQVGTHSKATVRGPGVVIGRSGSLGGGQYIRCDFWPLNTTLWVKDFKGNDRRFCYYLLKSLNLAHFNTGSGVPTLNRNHIHPLPLSVPRDPKEQHAIAQILGTLDDKIELNRRMNETLEQIARALFKSWFVDFDPVRAKFEGRDPGLPSEIADLFPDSFEESELGEIPKGWEVKAIEDVAARVGMGPFGSSIKVESFVSEGVPIISGQHLRGVMMEDTTFNFVSEEHAERLKAANVLRGDVVFTHAGSIGQVAYIPENSRYNRYVISQRQFFMRCDPAQVTPRFVAFYFRSPEGRHRLLANTSSSGVPSIARPVTYLRSIRLTVPPKQILDTFESQVQPLLSQFRRDLDESSILAALRDALLPKLISGELRTAHLCLSGGRQ